MRAGGRAQGAGAGACLQSVIVSAILSICVRYVSNWYVQLRLLPASPGVCEKCGYEFLSSAKGEGNEVWGRGGGNSYCSCCTEAKKFY